jgi:hypothetical protein
MKRFFIILIGIMVVAFNIPTDSIFLSGQLIQNPKNNLAYIQYLTVFIKSNNKILGKTISNANGIFSLTVNSKVIKSFDIFCTGVGMDTLFLASCNTFKSDTLKLTLITPPEYKKNFFGKIICPKCKKADMTIPIIYGESVVVEKIEKDGNETTNEDDAFNAGTCVEMPARYFCKRDKIKF